jgi:hypothetical protein
MLPTGLPGFHGHLNLHWTFGLNISFSLDKTRGAVNVMKCFNLETCLLVRPQTKTKRTLFCGRIVWNISGFIQDCDQPTVFVVALCCGFVLSPSLHPLYMRMPRGCTYGPLPHAALPSLVWRLFSKNYVSGTVTRTAYRVLTMRRCGLCPKLLSLAAVADMAVYFWPNRSLFVRPHPFASCAAFIYRFR